MYPPIARRMRVVIRRQPWVGVRGLTTAAEGRPNQPRPRRSVLYVPTSNPRMLNKSLETTADLVIYDLEDSVSQATKATAREQLSEFLRTHLSSEEWGHRMRKSEGKGLPTDMVKQVEWTHPRDFAVRTNAVSTPEFRDDLQLVVEHPILSTLVLPKVTGVRDLDKTARLFSDSWYTARKASAIETDDASPTRYLEIVASIESARALLDVGSIAAWNPDRLVRDRTPPWLKARGEQNPVPQHLLGVKLAALLFAAEDYCASTGIIRTPSRRELLYPRATTATAAKAYGLQAIDMVCVDYTDEKTARAEAQEAKELGYDGKQAIHPSQVEIYNATFVPTAHEIERAVKILEGMVAANTEGTGAYGLSLGGRNEMIDEPMVKQARSVLDRARQAGIKVPDPESPDGGRKKDYNS